MTTKELRAELARFKARAKVWVETASWSATPTGAKRAVRDRDLTVVYAYFQFETNTGWSLRAVLQRRVRARHEPRTEVWWGETPHECVDNALAALARKCNRRERLECGQQLTTNPARALRNRKPVPGEDPDY